MATSLQGIGGVAGARGLQALDSRWRSASPAAESGFADLLGRALGQVEGLQAQARDSLGAFVRGEPVELHQVMAAAEEAGLALDLLVELRNKLTDAYRSVMSMQS
jgi:flagellar hook-basal body complex protein FliE